MAGLIDFEDGAMAVLTVRKKAGTVAGLIDFEDGAMAVLTVRKKGRHCGRPSLLVGHSLMTAVALDR